MKAVSYEIGSFYQVRPSSSLNDVRRDFLIMKDLGLNSIVIWPAFFWNEDENPDYPFQTGGKILSLAEEVGLKIVLEVVGQQYSSEFMPDFLYKDDYNPEIGTGVCNPNVRNFFSPNYNHPEVRELIKDFGSRLGRFYSKYPALIGYDVFNETQFKSEDKYTLELFWKWLRKKYGSIKQLNARWERSYNTWTEIRFEKTIWSNITPVIDLHEFYCDNMTDIVDYIVKSIKVGDESHVFMADNIRSELINSSRFFERPQDDWSLATVVDRIGVSIYPKNMIGDLEPSARYLVYDAYICLSGRSGFYVAEMQTNYQSLFNAYSKVKGNELHMWAWEAMLSGAKGLYFFKWTPFQSGRQISARGIVDNARNITDRAEAIHELTNEIEGYQRYFIEGCMPQRKIAFLYDKLNQYLIRNILQVYNDERGIDYYQKAFANLYSKFFKLNIPVGFLTVDDVCKDDIKKYDMVFLPVMPRIGYEAAKSLLAYIETGGIIVSDGRFGLIDDNNILYENLPLNDLSVKLGYNSLDMDYFEGIVRYDDIEFPYKGEREIISPVDVMLYYL